MKQHIYYNLGSIYSDILAIIPDPINESYKNNPKFVYVKTIYVEPTEINISYKDVLRAESLAELDWQATAERGSHFEKGSTLEKIYNHRFDEIAKQYDGENHYA